MSDVLALTASWSASASSPNPPSSTRPPCSWRTDGATWSASRETNWPQELADIGEKPFRAKQVWHWIYHQGVTDFARMSSIAKPAAALRLAERFVIERPEVATVQTAADDTRKWLFRFRDGQEAETVYIPDRTEDRGAVCISSQVGCTLSCRFCHTGTQRLVRNLAAPRDRRPVHGRPRQLRRMAQPARRNPAPAQHNRPDGHGRTPLQL